MKRTNVCKEYNCYFDVASCAAFFASNWASFVTAPLDTTQWRINGHQWSRLQSFNQTGDVIVKSLLETMCFWMDWKNECQTETDVLYDPTSAMIAGDLALDQLIVDELPIVVSRSGETLINATSGSWKSAAVRFKSSQSIPTLQERFVDLFSPRY